MFKKALNAGLLFLMLCTLAACGIAGQQNEVMPGISEDGGYESVEGTQIKMITENTEVVITLNDSRTAADLAAMLPLELTLIERSKFAKGMTLPDRLSSSEATTREYEVGDFGYWNAGPDLAIFYDDIYEQTIVEVIPFGHVKTGAETMANEADVIVLATPVYFYTMCAQMKTMIDRTLGGAQKSGLENKELYLIATAADGKAAMERTVDGLRGYIECLPGAKEMGVIYGAGAWQLGDIQGNPAMQEAYQMGRNIC